MKTDALTRKKAQLDALRPLPSALVDNLDRWFKVELTFTSNALEGNTLTRRETALVVEKGLTVGGKALVEHLEATNHSAALDWVETQLSRSPATLRERDILQLHDIILRGIDTPNAGHYRSVSVRISGSTVILPNPRKVPDLMVEMVDWLRTCDSLHPVELAAEAHYRLVTIHPFTDGNGRSARLLMNMILLMSGYPPAIIRQRDRLAYISALEQAQLGGSKADYLKLIAKAVDRSLNIYLKAASGEQAEAEPNQPLLKIGQLAKQAGESNSTLRHWTQQGLLVVAEVTPSGYQLYAAEMVDRIKAIHRLKSQRLSLQEIKQHLGDPD